MRYEMISADCHLDLCWLPPDHFTSRASAARASTSRGDDNLPADVRRKIVCETAAHLYNFAG